MYICIYSIYLCIYWAIYMALYYSINRRLIYLTQHFILLLLESVQLLSDTFSYSDLVLGLKKDVYK